MAQTYFKEWRKHRHLTQEDVINRLAAFDDPLLPQTGASLSRIENGKQIYTQRTWEALAEVYACEPHELLGRNPTKEGLVIDLLARLSESQARQVRVMIEALVRDAG
jgi:transcriptional regulator with XRE-family HTH domain